MESLSQIERLKKELNTKKNIVIISGAGISTNTGEQKQRELEGKQQRSTGSLRLNVLLYREGSPEELDILAAFNNNLHQPVNAVIIIGTRLEISNLRDFIEELYENAKSGNKEYITVWVNREPLKLREGFEIDY
ncbi:hypothetical protein CC78DRAFT_547433 [Lojkania enalia]|uniref:Deacetylase sirtuin-type domain-containing protein n=1 Tax=Lojkania enalia TaxID=147567 RepID=A0A9P4K0B8_9PLEO|nr:hypothetical protein CC78DRAFT_547433 [Didymosphaeria enalia]